jgi:hypothetical protein
MDRVFPFATDRKKKRLGQICACTVIPDRLRCSLPTISIFQEFKCSTKTPRVESLRSDAMRGVARCIVVDGVAVEMGNRLRVKTMVVVGDVHPVLRRVADSTAVLRWNAHGSEVDAVVLRER